MVHFQKDLCTLLNEGYPILKWQNPDAEYAVTLYVQPIDAVVTINGVQQPASETGVYTASGLKSGESCTYEVVQKEDAETDLAAQSGSITVGKSDVTKNIKLIPNEYSLQFNLTPQDAGIYAD